MKTIVSRSSLVVLAWLFVGCSSTRLVTSPIIGQHAEHSSFDITRSVAVDYLVYLPAGYESGKKDWPLVMFLHGAGERGTDITLVKKHGPPRLVEEGRQFDFIVVSPQCRDREWWDVDVLNALLTEVSDKYSVDQTKIYLTGLSMGGYATWAFAAKFPGRFAAIAPICGGGDTSTVCNLKNTPTWVFHGAKDNLVPLRESERMVSTLKQCGGDVQLTVYPEAGHDSWTETYNNQNVYEWMLAHSRSSK